MKPSRIIKVGLIMIVIALALLITAPMMMPPSLRTHNKDPEVKKKYDDFQQSADIHIYATAIIGIVGIGFIAIGSLRATKE